MFPTYRINHLFRWTLTLIKLKQTQKIKVKLSLSFSRRMAPYLNFEISRWLVICQDGRKIKFLVIKLVMNSHANMNNQLKKSRTFFGSSEKVLLTLIDFVFSFYFYFCCCWYELTSISNIFISIFRFISSSSCCLTKTVLSIDSNSYSASYIYSLSSILTSLFIIIFFYNYEIQSGRSCCASEYIVS